MSTLSGDVAGTAETIVVRNSGDLSLPAPAPRSATTERRRRPRPSFVARPIGIQARNDYQLFRVR